MKPPPVFLTGISSSCLYNKVVFSMDSFLKYFGLFLLLDLKSSWNSYSADYKQLFQTWVLERGDPDIEQPDPSLRSDFSLCQERAVSSIPVKGMIGREGTSQGGHFSLDVQQYL